ncbi:hypothetical protein ACFOWZ_10290 [Lentzea rhizosphaerae]|uniref:Uncharacterized protein n=1 Tax=Lentzea rhizosphaerae TaxID=2041025 RepID=A0ABV8BRB8_9PSEU
MVGEIITICAVTAAAVAKPAFDYLKVRVLAKNANKTDIREIAKVAFPRYQIGPLRRGPADEVTESSEGGESEGDDCSD